MKALRDLTEEQAIEIAKLLFPFPDLVKSEMKAGYDRFMDDDYEMEFYSVSFDIQIPETKHLICHIFPSLDCIIGPYQFIKYPDPRTDGYYRGEESYAVRNQYAIQKKFREWGIEPLVKNK